MHFFTPKRCEPTNKIMYQSKIVALRAAEDSRIERGVELWVYQCQYCNTWHLTHKDPQIHFHFNGGYTRKPTSRKKGYKPRKR
ncbi:hypothetical protein [Bifidobacterium cuniculi]|uniref:Uncharacterized protein n=1 Tax=Bifidobacterium cuniculi TaxID=1688 RepID=A0A087AZF3_9BIFI|nr:hypothetical protein [Bifidobacterium cuniculi]KFI64153.1 hypothetical protein BCUN_2014 [Bifidobacterium cuniculi]